MDQCVPCLVLVDPFGHRVKVLFEGGVRVILDKDVEDLQAFQLRVRHVVQSAGVNDQSDVPAGQHPEVQSRVQTAEVQTRTDLSHRHVHLQDKTEESQVLKTVFLPQKTFFTLEYFTLILNYMNTRLIIHNNNTHT